jgi:hypothetical protein
VPDDRDYEFEPVNTPDDSEISELVQQKSGAITNLFQAGIISQKVALKELKQMSESTGMFSNITDEDIEQADNSTSMGEAIPDGAFAGLSSMATPAQNRGGIQGGDQGSPKKAWSLADWIRRR